MKDVFRTVIRVYSIFCMCLVTLLLVVVIVVWANFGKITARVMENVINNYNTEINGFISNYFETLVPDNSVKFISMQTIEGGGFHAAFSVNDDAVNDVNISNYQEKSNEEILAELGITAKDLPAKIITLLSKAKEKIIIDFVDKNGSTVLNRTITSEEIKKFLRQAQ